MERRGLPLSFRKGALLSAFIALASNSVVLSGAARAADYPDPKTDLWVAKDFRFHTGEVLPELKIGYMTVGEPSGEPVLLLHISGASGAYFMNSQYAGELFGPGQPLDASKYFIIIPDAIGSGRTSKPSDELGPKFPHYDYTDLVRAQYRLLTEALNIRHLRLVSGNSMGGMESWLWAELYPDFMDGVVPLASSPARMSGRNWMTRRLLIETIKRDPEYKDGYYNQQPQSMKLAFAWFGIATNGGSVNLALEAPNSAAGDRVISAALNAPTRGDANDLIYQYEASADYDPWSSLTEIKVPILALNSQDDERNPPELGVMEQAMRRNKNIRQFLIPISTETRGHSTSGIAKLWKDHLSEMLSSLPKR